MVGERQRVVYQRNADRLFVPASTAKLAVAAAVSALLPADLGITTSVYAAGHLADGVLNGDLVPYGRSAGHRPSPPSPPHRGATLSTPS